MAYFQGVETFHSFPFHLFIALHFSLLLHVMKLSQMKLFHDFQLFYHLVWIKWESTIFFRTFFYHRLLQTNVKVLRIAKWNSFILNQPKQWSIFRCLSLPTFYHHQDYFEKKIQGKTSFHIQMFLFISKSLGILLCHMIIPLSHLINGNNFLILLNIQTVFSFPWVVNF